MIILTRLTPLMAKARHAQITQNNKFAISLQYLQKEGIHEVDFLQTKQTSLQVNAPNNVTASHSQNTQNNRFAKSLQYLKKKVRN